MASKYKKAVRKKLMKSPPGGYFGRRMEVLGMQKVDFGEPPPPPLECHVLFVGPLTIVWKNECCSRNSFNLQYCWIAALRSIKK